MSTRSVADDHYKGRQRLVGNLAAYAKRLWAQVDPARLDGSWEPLLARLLTALTAAQASAGGVADEYLDAVLAEQALTPESDGTVRARALAGIAADGRDLVSLLRQPVIATKAAIAVGAPTGRAMATGYAALDMIVRTEVADAGRVADQIATAARPAAEGYTRLAVGKTCSRCLVLAGRWYEWNAGFDRHPRCDCIHVPGSRATNDVRSNPRAHFDSLSEAEQDRLFTRAGAQAIREGADIGRVVNARRGMYTAGGRQFTREATTRRGIGRTDRLMPEQIFRDARNRDEAVRLLREHGYLVGPRRPAVIERPAAVTRPPVIATPQPATPIGNALEARVKSGIVDRQVLSGGQNARTEILTLADGSKVVFKKAKTVEGRPAREQQDAEELVPEVLRAAGLRAPEIYRPSANQLYMEHFEGTIGTKFGKGVTHDLDFDAVDNDQALLLGLVDQITDNYDRNLGNFLVAADGKLLPIDHGFAFSFSGSSVPRVPMWALGAQPSKVFVAPGDRWAEHDISPADIAVLRDRLVALRPRFEQVGRGDWHSNMLERLDALTPFARGTKRRIQ